MSYIGMGHAERLDRHDAGLRVGLQGEALDLALTSDGRVGHVEEPQALAQAAANADVRHAVGPVRAIFDRIEPEVPKAFLRPLEKHGVAVADPQCLMAATSLGIEHAGKEPPAPSVAGPKWPRDQVDDGIDTHPA